MSRFFLNFFPILCNIRVKVFLNFMHIKLSNVMWFRVCIFQFQGWKYGFNDEFIIHLKTIHQHCVKRFHTSLIHLTSSFISHTSIPFIIHHNVWTMFILILLSAHFRTSFKYGKEGNSHGRIGWWKKVLRNDLWYIWLIPWRL